MYGLGYDLLVFVYEKTDIEQEQVALLRIRHVIFIDSERTGDYQTTRALRQILANDGNAEDLEALFLDRNLPLDDLGRRDLAERVLSRTPEQGYLTISNALQWRLQYGRAIGVAQEGEVSGVEGLAE